MSEHEDYLLKSILSNSMTSNYYSKKRISSSYFDDLKEKLLKKYENKKLEDIEGSKVINTGYGETLAIVNRQKIDFNIYENNFKDKMHHNLKLIPKIGVKKEEKLKMQGYNTIESLTTHDAYADDACRFLDDIDKLSFREIFNLLDSNKYGKECRDNLIRCVSLAGSENFKFMDIETMGLSNVPIILIGVAELKNNKIISTQYFLRDYSEEIAIIDAYFAHLDENSIHVTFNGRTFDEPFIRNRINYHRLDYDLNLAHIDLRNFSKSLWGDDLPNCKLQTIEKYKFGIERVGDVPGQYIPGYYKTYLSENNIGPMIPIIEHNRQDIVSLAIFLAKMYDEVN